MDDAALPSLERVWEVATRGNVREINQLLASFPASHQLGNPLAIALRAIKNVLAADVPGGIALLRRAVEHTEGRVQQYLVDLLVPLVVSVGDFAAAEALLDEVPDVVPELAPAYLAARAVIAAREGYDDRSRAHADEALAAVRHSVDPMVVARTLQRVGLAAFYTLDYDRAQEVSLEAARAYERIGALRQACNAYSVLYAIAVGWLGDPVVARSYATRIATIAETDGDLSMQNLGLVAQLEIAAESGDNARYESTRARLLANPLHEQYRERFSFVLAEVLTSGWAGRFQQARAAILGIKKRSKRSGLSPAENMLCDALLAVFELARWNVDEARELAHSVVSRTTVHPDQEPLFDSQRRRAARILAAAACIISGETTRGRRALSRAYDPDGEFAKLDPVKGLAEDAVPPFFRGYARLLNSVCAAAARHRPQFGLTKAEMEILLALPSGDSVAEIANALNKSKRTVESQLEKIYAKMDVSTRAQAVAKARSLGLDA